MSWRDESDSYATLFDRSGRRKYLAKSERDRFLTACSRRDDATAAFARLLAYTGCRISEALDLKPNRLDPETGRVVFRTLKRRRLTFRAVPIPSHLMEELIALAHGRDGDENLWKWCRQTAWRRVKSIMAECGIVGAQAMPKGLRHSFGIANAEQNVPPGLTRIWMGHARIETTAIYQHAAGDEERAFAERIWRRSEERRH